MNSIKKNPNFYSNFYSLKENFQKSFTLVELLIVIGIIAVLTTAVIVTLNPLDYLKQARDAQRVSDLDSINKALLVLESQGYTSFGNPNTVYVSIPDTSSTCANLGLPSLPSGWSYSCVTQANLQRIDGNGWIPVNFSQSRALSFSKLPIDPINATSTGNYYTYVTGGSWELTSLLESDKYISSFTGGNGVYYRRTSVSSLTPFTVRLTGLLGHWSFDEGSGLIANDSSGKGNHATLYNGPIWETGANCKKGSCLNFDGVNDYALASVNNLPKGNSPRTILAWVKPLNSVNYYGIVGYGNGDCTGKQFYFGRFGTNLNFWGGCMDTNFSSFSFPLSQWTFVGISFDGSTVKAFKNGNFVQQFSPSSINTPSSVTKFVMGAESTTNGVDFRSYFNGLLDEIYLFNRALSDSEILSIYQATN